MKTHGQIKARTGTQLLPSAVAHLVPAGGGLHKLLVAHQQRLDLLLVAAEAEEVVALRSGDGSEWGGQEPSGTSDEQEQVQLL